jgi:LytS/YehU family sensor histidine kinase
LGLVYNLEDADLVRGLSGQLALAIERLMLVEREKTLIRVSAEAELKALRAQINPHFLFNALNTIISLIEERPEEAEETVQHLAAIFRQVLQTSSRTFITLDEEMNLVNHYLSIEKARFGKRLQVEQRMAPELNTHPVPAFVVQTIVENAIKHGLEKKRGKGILKIVGQKGEKDMAEVCIFDSGVGIPHLFENAKDTSFYGLGLQNIATRLEKLYHRDDLLQIYSEPGSGTEVKLMLPTEYTSDPASTPLAPDSTLEPAAPRDG